MTIGDSFRSKEILVPLLDFRQHNVKKVDELTEFIRARFLRTNGIVVLVRHFSHNVGEMVYGADELFIQRRRDNQNNKNSPHYDDAQRPKIAKCFAVYRGKISLDVQLANPFSLIEKMLIKI